MKFAKLYQETLENEGIPKDWMESGIQYKALKKCINQVVEELKQVGLERETLQALLQYQSQNENAEDSNSPQDNLNQKTRRTSSNTSSKINMNMGMSNQPYQIPSDTSSLASRRSSSFSLVSYKFDGNTRDFSPKIVVTIDESSNVPIEAKLSAKTLENLQQMANNKKFPVSIIEEDAILEEEEEDEEYDKEEDEEEEYVDSSGANTPTQPINYAPSISTLLEKNSHSSLDLPRADAVSIISSDVPFSSSFHDSNIVVLDSNSEPESNLIYDSCPLSVLQSSLRDDQDDKSLLDFDLDNHRFTEDRIPLIPHVAEFESEEFLISSPSESDTDAIEENGSGSANDSSTDVNDTNSNNTTPAQPKVKVVEIHLKSDTIFFQMLMSELKSLDAFNRSQEEHLTNEVDQLRNAIASLVDPKSRKTDMYIWREIFKEYMSSNIFFATMESDHGEHDVDTARRKLIHFAARILGFTNSAQLFEALGFHDATETNNTNTNNGNNANAKNQAQNAVFFPLNMTRTNQSVPKTSKELLELEHASTARIESVLAKFFGTPNTPNSSSTSSSNNNNNTSSTGVGILSKKPGTLLTKLRQHHVTGLKDRKNLIAQFRNRESYASFRQFWTLNTALLRVLQFQAMNRMAITKILKKFDKQTALDARVSFPGFLGIESFTKSGMAAACALSSSTTLDVPFLSHSLAKNICFVITERLLPVTPQIGDFLCPVCLSIAFKPIRLSCNHIFCVRCMIQLQRAHDDKCPMCRQNVVLAADEHNLDTKHMDYLKLHFPKETKLKQQEMEKQIVDEQMDHLKKSGECVVM